LLRHVVGPLWANDQPVTKASTYIGQAPTLPHVHTHTPTLSLSLSSRGIWPGSHSKTPIVTCESTEGVYTHYVLLATLTYNRSSTYVATINLSLPWRQDSIQKSTNFNVLAEHTITSIFQMSSWVWEV
jgi:hypothetical protein